MSEHGGLRTLLVSVANSAETAMALSEHGLVVMGPAPDATVALTLAAQSHADVALIHVEVQGPRQGQSLASALRENWGVPSVLFEAGAPGADELARIVQALREAARTEAG